MGNYFSSLGGLIVPITFLPVSIYMIGEAYRVPEDTDHLFSPPCVTTKVKFDELPTEILLKIASLLGTKSQVCGFRD